MWDVCLHRGVVSTTHSRRCKHAPKKPFPIVELVAGVGPAWMGGSSNPQERRVLGMRQVGARTPPHSEGRGDRAHPGRQCNLR